MHATFLDNSILKDKILEVPRVSKQTGLRQATDEGLSYPVYIVQKPVSSSCYSSDSGSTVGYKPP